MVLLFESLILDIIHVLQENVVDTKTDVFLRDLAIVIEAIKGFDCLCFNARFFGS